MMSWIRGNVMCIHIDHINGANSARHIQGGDRLVQHSISGVMEEGVHSHLRKRRQD